MAKYADPSDVIRAEAPAVLRFLAEDWGFTGPEITDDGIAFHRSGLHIHMGFWSWKNESGFLTTLTQTGADGTEVRAGLGELYAACGVGTAHDVAEGAGKIGVGEFAGLEVILAFAWSILEATDWFCGSRLMAFCQ